MSDDPQRDPWRELNAAAQVIREVGETVDRDREANERAARLNEERIAASVRKFKAWRIAGIIGIVLGVLAIVLGAIAVRAISEINESRRESRVASCESYNRDLVTNVNALNDRTQQLLVAAAAGGNRTAEQQARTDLFVSEERAKYERIKLEPRDCTPAGLERFFSRK